MTVDTVNIKILNAEVKAMFEEDMKEIDTTSFNELAKNILLLLRSFRNNSYICNERVKALSPVHRI